MNPSTDLFTFTGPQSLWSNLAENNFHQQRSFSHG
ncbi:hypothetical protein F0726_00673 [Acidithiobacillus caldus]|nr:hypothetical protein F0726_00673 [Acidithiobacillus caldus]